MIYSEVYNKAADIVEKGWTQGDYARDESGRGCGIESSDAVSWCISGALSLAQGPYNFDDYSKLAALLGLYQSLPKYNDHPSRTQEEVVELLRYTARRADKEGSSFG